MGGGSPLVVGNAAAVPLRDVPEVGVVEFRATLLDEIAQGGRVSAFFGTPCDTGSLEIVAVVARPAQQRLGLLSTVVADRYPSLTPDCPQLVNFEREIAEQWGVLPEGHPWLKPLRRHGSFRNGTTAPWPPSAVPFFAVEGEEVHEVAVGPVHAGIIEPGHFRFQCHGETVLHLEISLGYQHRGVETALVGGPDKRTIHYMETVAGDTTVGHALAYARAVEALAGREPPAGAEGLRCLALELERLANHGLVLRPAPRRVPEPYRPGLWQPPRARLDPAGWSRLRRWRPRGRDADPSRGGHGGSPALRRTSLEHLDRPRTVRGDGNADARDRPVAGVGGAGGARLRDRGGRAARFPLRCRSSSGRAGRDLADGGCLRPRPGEVARSAGVGPARRHAACRHRGRARLRGPRHAPVGVDGRLACRGMAGRDLPRREDR